jgi:hypothetical protein
MSNLLSELKSSIRNAKREWRDQREYFKTHEPYIIEVIEELNLDLATSTRMLVDREDVNFYVTGDAPVLKEIFRGLRKLGYEPSKRPGVKPESNFTTYFSQDGKPTFYLSFSSTLCRRVKVGTKMVEQDIFEVQCE